MESMDSKFDERNDALDCTTYSRANGQLKNNLRKQDVRQENSCKGET